VGPFDLCGDLRVGDRPSGDTDFTGENVKSLAATGWVTGRKCFAIVPAASQASACGRP
jgi:hypothetical protein